MGSSISDAAYFRQSLDALRRALDAERHDRLDAHERHERAIAALRAELANVAGRADYALDWLDQGAGKVA